MNYGTLTLNDKHFNVSMLKVHTGSSPIQGIGIFVNEDIKKGGKIFVLKGKPVIFFVKNKSDALSHPNWLGIGKHRWLELEPPEPGIHLNHSCNPNAGIRGKVVVTALKHIKKNEEITIDYSTTEGEHLWQMRCRCGTIKCRHTIRSIQYLPLKTFQKYLPFIPRYFQQLYNAFQNGK